MTQVVLNRSLGEGGAHIGDSHGSDNLFDVLKALADGSGGEVSVQQATIATATLAGFVVDKAGTVELCLATAVGTTGTAGQTDVQVNQNGVLVPGTVLSTTNAEADGIAKVLSPRVELDVAEGDLIEVVVSAAPTGGADLTASLKARSVKVQA